MHDVITLRGKVGSAPVQVVTSGGLVVSNFSLATDQRQFDKATNKWTTTGTNWFRVAAHWHLSHNVAASLKVGDHIIVMGELRLTPWDNGVRKGIDIDVIADTIGHDLFWCTTNAVSAAPGTRRVLDQAERQEDWLAADDPAAAAAGEADDDIQSDDGFLPAGASGFASLES